MRRRAFTLVELLVVVSIVALLIALMLPALKGAREQARRIKCAANLRMFGMAMMIYDQDNGMFPPSAENVWVRYANVMRDVYGVQVDTTVCPSSAPRTFTSEYRWQTTTYTGQIFYRYLSGYGPIAGPEDNGWNRLGFPLWKYGFFPPLSARNTYHFLNALGQIAASPRPPDQTFMMTDLSYYSAQPGMWPDGLNPRWPQLTSHLRAEGNCDGANWLFLDGRVQWHPIVPGKTWKVAGNIGRDFGWWQPGFGPPNAPASSLEFAP